MVNYKDSPYFFCRLLDVFHTTSPSRQETHLSLVFEHIEQDLSVYLDNCPQPGLPEWKIKVNVKYGMQSNTTVSPKWGCRRSRFSFG